MEKTNSKKIYFEFNDFVNSIEIEDDFISLPIFHTTPNSNISKISKAGKLIPTKCKHFNEEVLYFSYGIPCYIPGSHQSHHYASNQNPITFIFDISVISESKSDLYPFDTGGIKVKNEIGIEEIKKMRITLDENNQDKKLLKITFGKVDTYLNFSTSDERIDSIEGIYRNPFVREVYENIIKIYNSKFDDKTNTGVQAHVFEIQFKKEIKIKGNVKAVIFPEDYFRLKENCDGFKEVFGNAELFEYKKNVTLDKKYDSVKDISMNYIRKAYFQKEITLL